MNEKISDLNIKFWDDFPSLSNCPAGLPTPRPKMGLFNGLSVGGFAGLLVCEVVENAAKSP